MIMMHTIPHTQSITMTNKKLVQFMREKCVHELMVLNTHG